MGGAMKKLDPGETAIGRRDVSWCYHALSMWMEPGEEAEAAHVEWARRLSADLEPETTEGVYLNFTSDAGDERVRKTFGEEKYAKLVALKNEYDPTNVFRLNQNIEPSGTE
jgi:FAD/FMN-containing dehydrogenase